MRTLLTALLGFSLAAMAQPRRADWTYLGEAHVDGAVDHDRIMVTAAKGEYRAIRLRVENGPIRFDRVLVHFGNGSTTPIQIRRRIPAGGETRAIDLPGDRRIIESVELWYERGSWRSAGRPKVSLFGLN